MNGQINKKTKKRMKINTFPQREQSPDELLKLTNQGNPNQNPSCQLMLYQNSYDQKIQVRHLGDRPPLRVQSQPGLYRVPGCQCYKVFCAINKTTKNNNKTPPNTKASQKSFSLIKTERILNSYSLVKGLEKWHGLYGKQYGRFPQILTKSYLLYNPVYYLVYTQEVGTIVAVCTPTYVHILLQIKDEGNPGFY